MRVALATKPPAIIVDPDAAGATSFVSEGGEPSQEPIERPILDENPFGQPAVPHNRRERRQRVLFDRLTANRTRSRPE